jgi:hypothetical protein
VTAPLTAEQRAELRRLEKELPHFELDDSGEEPLVTLYVVGTSDFAKARSAAVAQSMVQMRNALPALLDAADRAEGLEARNNAALDRLCYMQQEVDARRADLSRKGGQQVSFHGDFAGVSPSALGRIEWHIRAILDALGSGEGPAQYLEAELRKCQEEAVVMAKRVRMLEGLLGLALRWSVGLPRHMDERIRKALAQRQPEGEHR